MAPRVLSWLTPKRKETPGRRLTRRATAHFGQMKMNEVAGVGNWTTAEFWEYDTRTATRKGRDPKPVPDQSPYAVFSGNPIRNSDVDGDQPQVAIAEWAFIEGATMWQMLFGAAFIANSSMYIYEGANAYSKNPTFNMPRVYGRDNTYAIPMYHPMSDRRPFTAPKVRVVVGDKVKEMNERKFYYVTYQMTGKGSQVYIGRTSGYGTSNEIVAQRMKGHHMQREGFDPSTGTPITAAESTVPGGFSSRKVDAAYWYNRGAEEAGIQMYRAMGISGNTRAGISATNKSKDKYNDTYRENTSRDEDNCVNCGSLNSSNIDVGTPGVKGTTR